MAKQTEIIIEDINMHLENVSNAYSKFSDFENGMLILDDNFVTYVNECAKEKPLADVYNLNINVNGGTTEKVNTKFSETFKKYYDHEINENKKALKRLNIISLTLLLIGVVFIVALHFLSYINTPYIISTILEICAWVFVWEFVDTFFFKKFGYKIKNKVFLKLRNSNIKIY